jgi:Protein of unknown function (DUF1553)
MNPNCERRNTSTAAPQALLMMNNVFIMQQSERFARRVIATAGDEPAAQVRLAWQLAFSRDPNETDLAEAQALVAAQKVHYESLVQATSGTGPESGPKDEKTPATPPAVQALASLCQALFCSNPFLYVE